MKEPEIKTSVIIRETPQPTQKKTTKVKETIQEQSTSKSVQKRLTRSEIAKEKGKTMVSGESLGLKGDLNDMLQAIDIEESPLVQADFIKLDEGKSKKMKSSKKLDFDDDISEFVFKPRKRLARQSKKLQGLDMELETIGKVSNVYEEHIDLSSHMPEDDKNRVFHNQTEKSSREELKRS